MIKKILIILIIGNLFLGGWVFRDFFREKIFNPEKVVVENKSEEKEQSVGKGNKEEESLEKQPEDQVVAKGDIVMAQKLDEDRIIYFNQNNFLETDFNGKYRENLSSYPFKSPKTISCSKNSKYCIVWSDVFSIYNLSEKKNTKLSKEIVEVEFNSQEDGLVYLFKYDNFYELNTADLLGKNWIKVISIKAENLEINQNPKNNQIIYYSTGVDKNSSGVFLGELTKGGKFERIINRDIIDAGWSPSGDKILFSFYDHSISPKRVQLGIYDLNKKEEYSLGIPSIVQKCTWAEDSLVLYCAALTNSEKKVFKLTDWYKRSFVSKDVFWKIDLLNSQKERIFKDLKKYPQIDSFNLFVENKKLFFIDKITGNLVKREL